MAVKINLEPFCDGCAMVNVQVSEGRRPTRAEIEGGGKRADEHKPAVRCANEKLCRYLRAFWRVDGQKD